MHDQTYECQLLDANCVSTLYHKTSKEFYVASPKGPETKTNQEKPHV